MAPTPSIPTIPFHAALPSPSSQNAADIPHPPCSRGRPCASSCLQCPWLTEEGPACSQPSVVTFPTARLRAFMQEREKRRALLYKKHNLAQVR